MIGASSSNDSISSTLMMGVPIIGVKVMPRRTRKWVTATEKAQELGLAVPENQETLYRQLNEASYYWQSDRQLVESLWFR